MSPNQSDDWHRGESVAGRNTIGSLFSVPGGGLSFGEPSLAGGVYLASSDGVMLLRTTPVSILGGRIMQRRKAQQPAADKPVPCHRAPMETLLFQKLPNVMAHLAINRLDDGTPRRPGSVIVMSSGSGYRLIAKEPDEGLELEAYGETIDDAFALLELLLGTDDCPWQPEREWKGPRTGKRKT